MRHILTILILLSCVRARVYASLPPIDELAAEDVDIFDRFYTGTQGVCLLPGNGNSLSVTPAVSVSFGWYAIEKLAFETTGLWAPNAGGQSLFGFAGRGLWHLFGYERFDPFVTLGVQGLLGHQHTFAHNRHRSALGPEVGFGAFYHLTEHCSFRADARAVLTCDSPCGMIYSISAGLQYSFGDEGE